MINTNKVRWVMVIVMVSIALRSIIPALAAGGSPQDPGRGIVENVHALIPTSVQMVDRAILVLSKGWNGMSQEERQLFSNIYDPGNTGEIDDRFVEVALVNYQMIRGRLVQELVVVYKPDSDMCDGMRLYYTDFMRMYVCSYYTQEDKEDRKARVLVHEVAHMALWVVDRPYYDPKSYSSRYNALTPRPSWVTEIPLIGHILREIAQSDTLYHPDAYSWFAAEVVKLSN